MEQISWTNSDIRKLFKMDNRFKSIQTLYNGAWGVMERPTDLRLELKP